ncbi:glycosyltransferase family 2 protein [Photobacterium leiognathi]|uniref:glycosyltransferase family 2 protein n=1 Tax=Photobacterium leiognathi TaxID=553611 RepID=UPI00273695A4|nr:glycosyltransferase family 2 protein [Photobacterium leiognathi]
MIVIPMAGLSSRFFKEGFTKPKYMLEAKGKTLFAHSVLSFAKYFNNESFLFIVRDVYDTPNFVQMEIKKLGIKHAYICILEQETQGQAETVSKGLESIPDDGSHVTVFNIDTFRPEFTYPDDLVDWDSYIEVFKGAGENWSFAKPLNSTSTRVIETAEKKRISDLCSTGLYYFKNRALFNFAYQEYIKKPKASWDKGELYVAPLYNELIKANYNIHYHLISRDSVIFCGVPDEYYDFIQA